MAGAPAQFIRAIGDRSLSGQLWRGFVSLGDFWRASDDLQLMYGARFESDRVTNKAAVDDDVARAFGIADGTSHDQVAISPRLGFRWVYRQAAAKQFKSYGRNPFGYFDNSGPSFVVRGGIGAFRNTPTASVLSNAVIRAGMPLGGQRLICLGSAVPSADWTAFAADRNSIPSACTAGSAVTMANVAPGASFIDSRYSSPTSWRGNLSVVTELWNWRATVDGTVSLNRNQQSTRDLNFANVVQFRTTDEQRPVFTPINDIVDSTGAVSPIGARTDARFGRVLAIGSDARLIDNEVTIKLVPDYGVLGDGWLSLAYTLSSSRMRANGFDVPTFGSPVALQSGRNDFVPRHQFSVQAGYRFAQGLSASIFGNFWSGLPFTPMVGADVNGDGLANDRAFVFSPSAASDSAIANGMAALLSNGRGNGARCLAS